MEGGHVRCRSVDIKISLATLKGDENGSSDSNTLSWFDHRVRCSIASSHLINPLLSSYNKHPTSAYSCLPQSDPTQILFLALSWFDHRVQCSAPSSHQPPPFLFSKHPMYICSLLSAHSDPTQILFLA